MVLFLYMRVKDTVSFNSFFHLTDLSIKLNTLKAIINIPTKGNQMKNLLILLMFSSSIFTIPSEAADPKPTQEHKIVKPVPAAPTGPRYTHIQGVTGEILATVDTKDNSIDYIKDCEEVTPVLIQALQQTHISYQNVLKKIKAELVNKSKKTLKKVKKK